MKNNVPFDTAMALPDEERLAYSVIFARFEGLEFCWDTLRYRERK